MSRKWRARGDLRRESRTRHDRHDQYRPPGDAALSAVPNHRRRLRKFLSLALPLDEVVYTDVDTILLRDFGRLFGLLDAADFIVACETTEYVYNRNRAKYPFLAGRPPFNDGFFVTSRRRLELAHFFEVIANDEAMFHEVRQRGMLFAQPLTNFSSSIAAACASSRSPSG